MFPTISKEIQPNLTYFRAIFKGLKIGECKKYQNTTFKDFATVLRRKEEEIEKWKFPSQIQYKRRIGHGEAENVEKLREKFTIYRKNENLHRKIEKIVEETAKYFADLNAGHFLSETEFVVRQRLQIISTQFNEFRMVKWEKMDNFWKWHSAENFGHIQRNVEREETLSFGAENLSEIEQFDLGQSAKLRGEIQPELEASSSRQQQHNGVNIGPRNKGKGQIHVSLLSIEHLQFLKITRISIGNAGF